MEAASSGLVIDRAIEPGVQIFGWEVANAAALELGRGARQRALDALGASEKPRAPSTVSQPLADRFPGRRIAAPSNEAARLEPEGSCRTPRPSPPKQARRSSTPKRQQTLSSIGFPCRSRSKCQSADLWEIMIKIGPGTVD